MNKLKSLVQRVRRPFPFNSGNKIRFNSPQNHQPLTQTFPNIPSSNTLQASTFTQNEDSTKYYKSLRIYREKSWYDLLNIIFTTTCCSYNFIDNWHRLYDTSHKILGSKITEFLVYNTMGRIYTSGTSLESMRGFIESWCYPNVNVLISYSNEAPLELITNQVLDENTESYIESIDLCALANQQNNGTAFKCSSLCPIDILKSSNIAQLKLKSFYSQGFGNLSETLTAQEIFQRFNEYKIEFSFKDFQEFASLFLGKEITEENINTVFITKFEWLNEIHMFYVMDSNKTNNKILRNVAKLTKYELNELEKFSQRIHSICQRGYQRKQKVLIDAEQTYMQAAIDSFAVQYSNIYNKEYVTVFNTFQNYLKTTKERLVYELERCKSLNLPFGAKIVRGAYMVEERRLAQELNYEDPIQPTIEDTHKNYNSNLEFLLSNWIQRSRIIIASHNEESVQWGKHLIQKYDINPSKGSILFAQLLGIGDHLTFSLAKEGYPVGKMCHFGPLHYMVPFLIRRAQESKQVLVASSLKRELAWDEISQRIKPNSKI